MAVDNENSGSRDSASDSPPEFPVPGHPLPSTDDPHRAPRTPPQAPLSPQLWANTLRAYTLRAQHVGVPF